VASGTEGNEFRRLHVEESISFSSIFDDETEFQLLYEKQTPSGSLPLPNHGKQAQATGQEFERPNVTYQSDHGYGSSRDNMGQMPHLQSTFQNSHMAGQICSQFENVIIEGDAIHGTWQAFSGPRTPTYYSLASKEVSKNYQNFVPNQAQASHDLSRPQNRLKHAKQIQNSSQSLRNMPNSGHFGRSASSSVRNHDEQAGSGHHHALSLHHLHESPFHHTADMYHPQPVGAANHSHPHLQQQQQQQQSHVRPRHNQFHYHS
jgi:hypothetical protein